MFNNHTQERKVKNITVGFCNCGNSTPKERVSNQMNNTDKISSVVNNTEVSTSEKIRQLVELGVTRGDVSRLLNIKYQFVRNVLLRMEEQNLKKGKKVERKGLVPKE